MTTQAAQQRSTELIASCKTTNAVLGAIVGQGFIVSNPGSLAYELKQLRLGESLPFKNGWGCVLRTAIGWELRRFKVCTEVLSEPIAYHKDALAFIA